MQVEYYFSDENLPTDKFLLKYVTRDKEGFGKCWSLFVYDEEGSRTGLIYLSYSLSMFTSFSNCFGGLYFCIL